MAIIIEFAQNEHGQKPVLDHLNALVALARARNADALWILPRIRRALGFVQRHGVPGSVGQNLSEVDDWGIPFTLAQPVKTLDFHPPIHELRVNRKGYGAFRALFFPYDHRGDQYLVFTQSVLKSDTSDPAFDAAVSATEAFLPEFLKDPRKYITL